MKHIEQINDQYLH